MSQYDENGTIKAEQEAIKKHEEQERLAKQEKELQTAEKVRIEKDRQIEEGRLADERQKAYEKNQEEIRKDSERRRQQDKDRKELSKHQEEVRVNREELMKADRVYQGGEKVIPMQNRIKELDGRELQEELKNTQKAFERQLMARAYGNDGNQRAIEKHDHFKGKLEEWQKVNRSIEQTKDRATLQKLHAKRDGIEKEIEKEHRVGRERPKFFDGRDKRQQLDRDYEGKLQDKMKELTKGKGEAEKSMAYSKSNDNENQDYKEYENSIREKVQQRMQEQADKSHTHSLGRGR